MFQSTNIEAKIIDSENDDLTFPTPVKVSSDELKVETSSANLQPDSDSNKKPNFRNDYKGIIITSKKKARDLLANTIFVNEECQESCSHLDPTQSTQAHIFEDNSWKPAAMIIKKFKKSHFKAYQEDSKLIGFVQIDRHRRRKPFKRSNGGDLRRAHFKVRKTKYNTIRVTYCCVRSQNPLETSNVVNFEEESATANFRNLMSYLEPSHKKCVFEPSIRFRLD